MAGDLGDGFSRYMIEHGIPKVAIDQSQIRVVILGPQGSGKSGVERELKKIFPRLLTTSIQTPTVSGESIVVRVGDDNSVETFFLNPTGPLGD